MLRVPEKGFTWCYKKLSACCCRLTKPRKAILDILSRAGAHYTADQIYKAASEVSPKIGLATIYRNLELLVSVGLVWKFDGGNSKTMYEIAECRDESHHHHLICKKCSSIIDYSGSINDEHGFMRQRENILSKKYGFTIENHCIDFYGVCSKCGGKG